MKIEVGENGDLVLKEVFNGVIFETDDGEFLGVAMRDDGFEIATHRKNSQEYKRYCVDHRGVRSLDTDAESVLPLVMSDDSMVFCSRISGGSDYVDGMPRSLELVRREHDGAETQRIYGQRDK